MNVLVVGAGAVGQVYAHHLRRGGAQVSFLVKPEHAGAELRGFTLYRLSVSRRPRPEALSGIAGFTTVADLGGLSWDQVWLCIAATALTDEWLEPFLAAVGSATVINLTPGLHDRARLAARVPAHRLVTGVVGMVAYQSPLPGEVRPTPGVSYWFPPLVASLFDGAPEVGHALARAVTTLQRGGCPARQKRGGEALGAVASAVMIPVVAALEAEAWSRARLVAGPRLGLASRAAREAVAVVAAFHDRRPPVPNFLLSPAVLKAGLALAPRLTPFDFDAYVRHHFTKVGDQTEAMLATWIAEGEARGLPTPALRELVAFRGEPSPVSGR